MAQMYLLSFEHICPNYFDDIQQTVMDGNHLPNVVKFVNEESNTTQLVGFTITNGYFDGGGSTYNGAGVLIDGANPVIRSCIIRDNYISWYGGGICIKNPCSPTLDNVTITNNHSDHHGGGIAILDASPVMTNTLIYSNSTGEKGGGLYAFGANASASITNCTIVENFAVGYSNHWGGAIYTNGGASVDLLNTIIWGNTPNEIDDEFYVDQAVNYSCIQGGYSGAGNINTDPFFSDPGAGDYTLSDFSPCIGAGLDTTFIPATDIEGNPRPNPAGSNPDMGAYENALGTPERAPVTINIPEDYVTIQAGLNAANSNDTVLVQPGTYTENIIWPETNGIKLISAGDSSNTIIDGGENSGVININPVAALIDFTTVIKGFKLSNGGNVQYGAGVYINGAAPQLVNLMITNNISSQKGGGLYISNSDSLIIKETIINNNHINGSWGGGGGVYMEQSSPIFSNVEVNNNICTGDLDGGGIYAFQSNPTFSNVQVNNNSLSDGWGGGIYIKEGISILLDVSANHNYARTGGGISLLSTSSKLNNVEIVGNKAWSDGGGLYISGNTIGSPVIRNTLIRNNTAGKGGGIYIYYATAAPVLDSVIVYRNSTRLFGGGVWIGSYSNPIITNMTIAGNLSHDKGGGVFFGNGQAELTNVNICNNTSEVNGGAVWLGGDHVLSNINITNNVSKDGFSGIYMSTGNPTVTHSNIVFNGIGFHNYDNSGVASATNNWWGHASGPYHPSQNPSGQGDSTNSYVNVTPWLTSQDVDAPPIPAQNAGVTSIGNDFVNLIWDSTPLGDFEGFKLYYDSDSSGYPYANSIDIGTDTSYTLRGLSPGTQYFVAITVYDTDGNESWYSNEVQASPQPAATISTNPAEINFSATLVGDTTLADLKIINTGTDVLNITDILYNTNNIKISTAALQIPVNEDASISIQLIASAYGFSSDTLEIQNNSFNSPNLRVPLHWFGDLPESPVLISVDDIPNDQGGQIRVSFTGSKYDGYDASQEILSYSVWRHIEGATWDAIGMFNAIQDSIYHFVAPTICDSTSEGICWSSYRVSAHTSDAEVFYFSDSLGGYSIDNIAPSTPVAVEAQQIVEGVELQWNSVSDKDFQYYAVYRSMQPGFNPDTLESYLYTTIDTILIDTDVYEPGTYYYRISAFDYSGNEGDYSEQVFANVVSISDDLLIPRNYALEQNYPNPFNPSTTIQYGLPKDSNVSLVIYDVRGQVVQTLKSEHQSAGWYDVTWYGETADGHTISTGIYFARLVAGEYSQVVKMLYLK